jgi:hypothetical protein
MQIHRDWTVLKEKAQRVAPFQNLPMRQALALLAVARTAPDSEAEDIPEMEHSCPYCGFEWNGKARHEGSRRCPPPLSKRRRPAGQSVGTLPGDVTAVASPDLQQTLWQTLADQKARLDQTKFLLRLAGQDPEAGTVKSFLGFSLGPVKARAALAEQKK